MAREAADGGESPGRLESQLEFLAVGGRGSSQYPRKGDHLMMRGGDFSDSDDMATASEGEVDEDEDSLNVTDENFHTEGLRRAKERAVLGVLHDYEEDDKGRRIPGTERLCDLMVSSERLGQIGGISTGLYFLWQEQEIVLFALISVICIVGLVIAGSEPCGFCHYKWFGDPAEVTACELECLSRPAGVLEDGKYSAWVIELSIAKNVYAVSPIWLDAANTIIIGVWLVYISIFRSRARDDLDSKEITVGDYSVMVQPDEWTRRHGLSQAIESDPSDVAYYFSHYGEVTRCVVVHNIGDIIVADAKLARYRQVAFELLQQRNLAPPVGVEPSTPPTSPRLKRQKSTSASLSTEELGSQLKAEGPLSVSDLTLNPLEVLREKQLSRYHSKILRTEASIERYKNEETILNSGYAFITFNHEDERRACLEDHARGTAGPHPRFTDPKDPSGESIRLNVVEPPEPGDIYFENLSDQGRTHAQRRWVVNLIALGLLVIGGIIQLIFIIIKDTLNEQSGTNTDTNTRLYVQLISILSAAVVSLIDVVLLEVFKKLSDKEMHHTRSGLESSMIWRQTVSQLANTTLIPIVTSAWRLNFDPQYTYSKWFIAGGLVEQMLYVQIFNIFSQHIYTLSQVEIRLAEMFLVEKSATQEQLDLLMRYPPFSIAYQYSYILKTVGMALFLGPVIPVSYVITFVALVLTYFVDRYTLLRIRERALQLDESVGRTVINLVKMMLFVRAFVAYFFWYRVPANSAQEGPLETRDHFQAFVLCTIFSGVSALGGAALVKLYEDYYGDDDQGTGGLTFHECERLNSETKGHFRALEDYTPFVTTSRLPPHLSQLYRDTLRSWKPTEKPMEGQGPGTHPSERPPPQVADLKAILKQSKLERMMNTFINRLRSKMRERNRKSTDGDRTAGQPGKKHDRI